MDDDFSERILARGRERLEAGDKSGLLFCLNHCVMNDLPIPEWLGNALADACHAVHTYKVKSWDDVFGKPLAKGKRLETERRNMEIADPIWRYVRKLQEEGRPIGKELFAAVGKEFGVSGTVAEEIYYDLMHEGAEMAADDDDIINRNDRHPGKSIKSPEAPGKIEKHPGLLSTNTP